MRKFPVWILWAGGAVGLLILGEMLLHSLGWRGGWELSHWLVRILAGIALVPGVFFALISFGVTSGPACWKAVTALLAFTMTSAVMFVFVLFGGCVLLMIPT